MTTTTDPATQTTQVYQVFIKASPEQIWDAITKPEQIARYFHGARLDEELPPGGRWLAWSPDHSKLWIDSEISSSTRRAGSCTGGARCTTPSARSRRRAA